MSSMLQADFAGSELVIITDKYLHSNFKFNPHQQLLIHISSQVHARIGRLSHAYNRMM